MAHSWYVSHRSAAFALPHPLVCRVLEIDGGDHRSDRTVAQLEAVTLLILGAVGETGGEVGHSQAAYDGVLAAHALSDFRLGIPRRRLRRS